MAKKKKVEVSQFNLTIDYTNDGFSSERFVLFDEGFEEFEENMKDGDSDFISFMSQDGSIDYVRKDLIGRIHVEISEE